MHNSLGVFFTGFYPPNNISERSIDTLDVKYCQYSQNKLAYAHKDEPTIKSPLESIRKDIAETEDAFKQQSRIIDELLQTLQKKA